MQFVGRVAYHDFGGVADEEEEMELVSKVAKDGDVIVLRNHGILVLGEDIERAFSRLYYYERACQCQLLVMVSFPAAGLLHCGLQAEQPECLSRLFTQLLATIC